MQHLTRLSVLCVVMAAVPALAQQATDAISPEVATSGAIAGLSERAQAAMDARNAGTPVTSEHWMVAAANPLAVEAGADVLGKGGTAADAMVAIQAVLGLVEPQSSGLGGGAFLVWYDAATGALTTLDGRETAPLSATPLIFLDDTGAAKEFWTAVVGGLSVGTPGTPALMEAAHRRWGRANWADLFDPAIGLAENGFTVSPRLASSIAEDRDRLTTFPATAAYFFPGGVPLAEGSTLTNPAYAETLRTLAVNGAAAFYRGDIGDGIVATVRNATGNPGLLSSFDLALYQVKERPAVCAQYRGLDVCGMGPPSSGALSVGQILGQLNAYDLSAMKSDDPQTWRLIGDSSRLAFADRGRYIADTDFVPVPVAGLVDPAYLTRRGALLGGDKALDKVEPGNPAFDHALNWADNVDISMPSTTQITVVDSYGNALSMTTTIEGAFGSKLMAPGGFLLNNELTDFSFESQSDGVAIANAVAPGKRPRSSMAPTIVLKDGAPAYVLGSPGGSRIIGFVARTIIAMVDWGKDPQAAISMPNLLNRFGTYDVEENSSAVDLAPALEALGYKVSIGELNSGLSAIAITPDGLIGGADPRREGIVLGN